MEDHRVIVRVLVADDHPVVLQGLAAMLAHARGITVVGTAANGIEAIRLYRQHRPDVVLLDLRMPGLGGLDALAEIRAFDAAARAIVLTTFNDADDVQRAVRAGARGYLLKDARGEEIAAAVQRVVSGQPYFPPAVAATLASSVGQAELTARELEVLELLARGERNRAIGQRLGITEGTVKGYVTSIMTKLGARDRTEAVILALRRGTIRLD
jgi:two-component system, NarL family, response regulator